MKRFYLQRDADASGVSGIGKVAEGCQFDTGWCALVWLTGKAAMSFYPDIETLDNIHGHQGMTKIVWIDDESSNVVIESSPPTAVTLPAPPNNDSTPGVRYYGLRSFVK